MFRLWKGPSLRIQSMEVSVMAIRYTSGRHGNVCLVGPVEHDEVAFETSPLLYHGKKGCSIQNGMTNLTVPRISYS